MAWICPYCGKENQCDDRIGMKEPRCVRCGKEKTTLEAVQLKARARKAEATKAMETLRKQIAFIDEQIGDLEEEIVELSSRRDSVMEELQGWIEEETRIDEKLESLKAANAGERIISADQTALGTFAKEGSEMGDHMSCSDCEEILVRLQTGVRDLRERVKALESHKCTCHEPHKPEQKKEKPEDILAQIYASGPLTSRISIRTPHGTYTADARDLQAVIDGVAFGCLAALQEEEEGEG